MRQLEIQEFDGSDAAFETWCAICNVVDPDHVRTAQEMKDWEKRREARIAYGKWFGIVEGEAVGVVEYSQQDALRDTRDDPFGICRHRDVSVGPEEHYTTVTAVVMDLTAGVLHLTDGPPDESPFQTIPLNPASREAPRTSNTAP